MEPVDLAEMRCFPGPERSHGAQEGKADLLASNSFAFMIKLKKKAKNPDDVH